MEIGYRIESKDFGTGTVVDREVNRHGIAWVEVAIDDLDGARRWTPEDMCQIVQKVRMPYRLTFSDESWPNGGKKTMPGRGNAGWTVGLFESCTHAREFRQSHPEAAMPCWRRYDW